MHLLLSITLMAKGLVCVLILKRTKLRRWPSFRRAYLSQNRCYENSSKRFNSRIYGSDHSTSSELECSFVGGIRPAEQVCFWQKEVKMEVSKNNCFLSSWVSGGCFWRGRYKESLSISQNQTWMAETSWEVS